MFQNYAGMFLTERLCNDMVKLLAMMTGIPNIPIER